MVGPVRTSSGRREAGRRAADLTAGTVLTLGTLPVVLLAALVSALALRAWPFFVQDRVGRDGTTFRLVKVRTLPTDTPGDADKHALDLVRIPRVCRFLRRLHIDELPQLFLVVSGRMSLIGPRPEMASLHNRLAPDFAALRTSVRPGCTGLWQVSEACTGLISAAPEYDRYYLANRSLRLDIWVLMRTCVKMVGARRCVSLEHVPAWTRFAKAGDSSADLTPALEPTPVAVTAAP